MPSRTRAAHRRFPAHILNLFVESDSVLIRYALAKPRIGVALDVFTAAGNALQPTLQALVHFAVQRLVAVQQLFRKLLGVVHRHLCDTVTVDAVVERTYTPVERSALSLCNLLLQLTRAHGVTFGVEGRRQAPHVIVELLLGGLRRARQRQRFGGVRRERFELALIGPPLALLHVHHPHLGGVGRLRRLQQSDLLG